MKSILIVAMVVSAAGVAVQSFAAPKADDAIKQVFAEVDRCVGSNDAECIGELLVEDATFVTPTTGAKMIKGKAQIVKALQELMGESDIKGVKQTQSVENVRMIGEDHAVVDTSIEVAAKRPGEGGAALAPRESYHAVAVVVRKGNRWLLQDLRSYVVETGPALKKEPAPAAKKEPAAPADKEPAAPANKKSAPAAKE